MKENYLYYLGLDLGSNSVGWAVTDEEYNIVRRKGKALWGIRLFEQADTAAERRIKRALRRRLERRKQRIDILQELFAEEMAKVDSTFYIRLNESRLHAEDKSENAGEKFLLFNDSDFTDKEYHMQYPTIFHLRKELIHSEEAQDIRLVYLAVHHIIKNRGHFLIDGNINNARSFKTTFEKLRQTVSDELDIEIRGELEEEFERILRNKRLAKSVKAKELTKLLEEDLKNYDKEEYKIKKSAAEQICKLVVGNSGDMKKLFGDEAEALDKSSFKFSDAKYEEEIHDELEDKLPERCFVVDVIKAVYDWSILVDILDGEEYLSDAKVKQYNHHKENLAALKKLMKKYCDSETYRAFFNDYNSKTNYVNYIGSVEKNGKKYSAKRCSTEDFYKELKNLLKDRNVDVADKNIYDTLIEEIENQSLLPLQRSKDNSVIPNQVHKAELEIILENAKGYLPFLSVPDENGRTVAEKIISLFSFRIPYYVGPLSDRHINQGANVWIKRKKDGRIYPWNFEEMVDEEASNEKFIERMTNKCTYLFGEDVVPKNSLIYSKYMVLNELNNLKIRGNKIPVELKQELYRELFEKHTRVTGKMLLGYMKQHDESIVPEDLSGFDKDFKASLNSYLDFSKKVFGDAVYEDKVKSMIEDIIRWKTIYGDDNRMFKTVVRKKYADAIDDEKLKQICKFRYSGWGNFSEKFLKGIMGADKETGETFSIIEALWETNDNLMQLLSDRYTFKEEIDKYNAEASGIITEISYETLFKDIYTSPMNKRTIWQTVQIAEEVKEVMGCAPAKIFIEMARENESEEQKQKNKGKRNPRKEKLLELYAGCKKDSRDWTKEISDKEDREFNSIKLFLYYTQQGRCMYTGEPIDLDELMSSGSRWDRDHIYPQSKIKDDSLDNLVLVNRVDNAKKDNGIISPEIQKKMGGWWKELLNDGFISKKKYDRLTKTGEFSQEELGGFISRQLVETRQSTKVVADLFKKLYTDSYVVYVKANLVSQFRHDNLKMLKSRRLNDYHHAKDAYLNIVVGNVYDAKFTNNPMRWLKENYKTNYSINRVFDFDVKSRDKTVWEAPDKASGTGGTIERIRETMRKNNILYTEYTYCEKGQLFNETLAKKDAGAVIRLKKDLDPEKYGGYTSPSTSYFALIEFDGKKNERVKNIIGVPVYIANMLTYNPDAFTEYCENIKGLKNVKVLREKIKKNSLLVFNGFPMRIRGENEKQISLKNNVQLVVDDLNSESIRLVERYIAKNAEYEANEKFDKLTEAKLVALYDVLCDKLNATIYKGRPANKGGELIQYRDQFIALTSLGDKARVCDQILNMLRCDISTTADLKLIGGKPIVGNIAVSKSTLCGGELFLINQSVTGIFENKIKL